MNLLIRKVLLTVLVIASVVIPLSLNCAAGVPNADGQEPALNHPEHSSFDTGDVSSIVFRSDDQSNLELQWWDKQKAEITWSVEVTDKPSGVKEADLNLPLKVIANKESGTITVQVVADKGRFKQRPVSNARSNEVSLVDTVTGVGLKVRIVARLPLTTRIDTNQFKGWIQFPDKAAGKQN